MFLFATRLLLINKNEHPQGFGTGNCPNVPLCTFNIVPIFNALQTSIGSDVCEPLRVRREASRGKRPERGVTGCVRPSPQASLTQAVVLFFCLSPAGFN